MHLVDLPPQEATAACSEIQPCVYSEATRPTGCSLGTEKVQILRQTRPWETLGSSSARLLPDGLAEGSLDLGLV